MANFQVKDFTTGLAVKIRAFLVNTDEQVAVHSLVDSANGEILGTKTDAASTATNTTAVSFMQVFKQISASVQSLVTAIGSTAWDLGAGAIGSRTQRFALASDSAGVIPTVTTDQAANYAAPAMRTVPQEVHIGEVGGRTTIVDVTLSADTSILADGDIIADLQQIDAFFRKTAGSGVIVGIHLIDEDDQKQAMDLVFATASRSLGTENSAPSISDANSRDIIAMGGPGDFAKGLRFAAADYVDLGGVSQQTKLGLVVPVKAVTSTDDLYVGAICRGGTPTYTSSGLKLRIAFLED